MSLIKFILLISLAGMAFNYWQDRNSEFKNDAEYVSDNGFVAVPDPANLDTNSVIVLAAKNCTKAAAKRADQLVYELEQQGIPYTRANSINFNNFDPALKNQLNSVMTGTLPIVLFNGRAKANPTLDEVVAEYNATYE